MQQENRILKVKCLFEKVTICFFVVFVLVFGISGDVNATETETINLGKVYNVENYYKFTTATSGKVTVKMGNLPIGAQWTVTLCDSNKRELSRTMSTELKKAVFYLKKAGVYYLKLKSNTGTVLNAKYVFSEVKNESGKSFSKAKLLGKGDTKNGVLGFDMKNSTKQYYKIKVDKEQLVKIQFTKKNSFSTTDVLQIDVYKSNNKEERVTWGWIFEGQNSATLYIRNSANYKTEKGTYYIALSKCFIDSGFAYTIKRIN